MSSYPGEHSNIPKHMLEALENQPLNHLVPKDGLATLITSNISLGLPHQQNPFDPSTASSEIEKIEGINLHFPEDTTNPSNQLLFRRPVRHLESGGTSQSLQFDANLSPLAKKCLLANNSKAIQENIKYSKDIKPSPIPIVEKTHSPKRPLGDISLYLEKELEQPEKKAKVISGVSMNQMTLGEQYIKDLKSILEYVGYQGQTAEVYANLEYWSTLPNDAHILTEKCIETLSLVLKNIVSIPQIWNQIETEWLQMLLNLLTDNIQALSDQLDNTSKINERNSWRRIIYGSTICIFTIFKFNRSDKRLSLERYVLTPLNFIATAFESTTAIGDMIQSDLKTETSYLNESISLLPLYIQNSPYLDDGLITKLVYVFTGVLMNDNSDFATLIASQNTNVLENIKNSSTAILVSLFAKLPDQRDFILQELLTQSEGLPLKRLQKKLRKVDNGTYVTDFTITILKMLEIFNCYDYAKSLNEITPDTLRLLENENHKQQQGLQNISETINETIVRQFLENTTKYRHVLDHYAQDLTQLLPCPQWPAVNELLSSLMKKLLTIFSPTHSRNTNIDSTCLQILGNIGSSIFELKCKIGSKLSKNLIELFNYPENVPLFLSYFEDCLEFVKVNSTRMSNFKYLWNQRYITLLKLRNFAETKEEEDSNRTIIGIVEDELSKLNKEELIVNAIKDSTTIEGEFNSILHAFEILNLYEPYLKLILSFLGQEKIKLRSTAIKCLSMLANKDANFLNNPLVKDTMQQRLSDSSASVKDAILDLVSINSSYLNFYKQINNNFDDDSILVRKRVLKINSKIYDESSDIETKIFVGSRILLKIEDEEDTIIAMAREILLDRWIFSIDALKDDLEQEGLLCSMIVLVLAGIASLNEKCSQLFDSFLNFYLLNEKVHTPPVYQTIKKASFKHFNELFGSKHC